MNEQVGLVTGGNRGIGRAVVEELASRGMVVVLGSRDGRHGARVAAGLSNVEAVELDVTVPDSIAAVAEHVAQRYGRLDVLVNNAGIAGDVPAQRPGSVTVDVCREVFATNVFGVISMTETMIPLLRRSPAGRVVNVTSGVGSLARMTDPADYFTGLPAAVAYPPSKSALNSITVQYAKALRGDGILVNAADPGACATDFVTGFPGVTRTAADGAAIIVRLATLDDDGPTGGYFDDAGPVPW